MKWVNIADRNELNSFLDKLTPATQANWGKMQPQHMVEHMVMVMQHTNGKKQASFINTAEAAKALKDKLVYTDVEIPMGVKSALLGEDVAPLKFEDLKQAKQALNKELDDFESYFKENPDAVFIQPRLGPLDFKEWNIFHNKHFTHHFKQFGLVE